MPLQLEYETYIRKRGLRRRLVDYTHPTFTLATALVMPHRIKILQSSRLRRDLGQKSREQLLPEGSGGVGVPGPTGSPSCMKCENCV